MRKILLATGDDAGTSSIGEFLKSKEYEVIEARNNDEAIKLAEDEAPDIILVDFLSENINGLQFCEKLREKRTTYLIPVIFLSEDGRQLKKIEGYRAGADDFLIKPYDFIELEARIENRLRRFHVTMASNPLTGLPGNVSIEWEVNKRLRNSEKFAVCYIDLDNFKAYNDKYGYEFGDKVIRFLARIISDAVNLYGDEKDFIGHIGGDDFILVTSLSKSREILGQIIGEFDRNISKWYTNEDRKNGYIEILNRQGAPQKFRIMTLSIGVAHNERRKLYNSVQISEIAAELKNLAKREDISSVAVDRRRE